MNLQIVIPGLVWPNPLSKAADGLALPALERLLGLGEIDIGERDDMCSRLARCFGLAAAVPVAALRRGGEADGTHPGGSHWLCADPVHLHLAREHLVLTDATALDIEAAEATALVDAINAFLADEMPSLGRLEAPTAERWYLRLQQAVDARFFALDDVVGRPIGGFTPQGEQARQWVRLGNEVQILLHNHPVNQARQALGKPEINSLWLWGAGEAPQRLNPPASELHADHPLAIGMARHAGMAVRPVGGIPQTDALVVIDSLHSATLQLDLERWRSRVLALEHRFFGPLLDQLRRGRLRRIDLQAPGDPVSLSLHIGAGARWKLWRRARRLDTLIGKPR